MKQIILVGISPLVKRRVEVFYIEELRSKGFHFVHCDLSPCFFSNLHYENVIDVEYALTFENIASFEEYLRSLEIVDTIFIVEVDHYDKYKAIFKLMKHYKCRCVKINPNASDFVGYSLPFTQRYKLFGLKNVLSNLTLPFRNFCHHIIKGNIYNIYSDYISSGNNPQIDIHINQQDWERARFIGDSEPTIDYSYAVFCDEYFPDHPDFNYLDGFVTADEIKKKYRSELIAFFDYLEKKYSIRVVVAAHPKSNYLGNEFGNREIIRGNTMELVKNAEFTIVHGSMSISFSLIFNIPVILAITDEMLNYSYYKWQSSIYSYYFSLPVYNLSNGVDDVCPKLISPSIRNKYIYDFLTSPGLEDKKNADILAEAFSRM